MVRSLGRGTPGGFPSSPPNVEKIEGGDSVAREHHSARAQRQAVESARDGFRRGRHRRAAATTRATAPGAGILSPETNSRDPELWFRLAVAAVGYYPAFIERLRSEQAG